MDANTVGNRYAASAAKRKARLAEELGHTAAGNGSSQPPSAAAVMQTSPPATSAPTAPAVPRVEEAVRHQGVRIRARDEELLEVIDRFAKQNRKRLKNRKRGISIYARAGWKLLHDAIEKDPDRAVAALDYAVEENRPPVSVGSTITELTSPTRT